MGQSILILWFFCPLIVPLIAALARDDESEAGGCAVIFVWAIVGAILGPLALIAVFVAYLKNKKEKSRLIECPACYNNVSRNADSCPNCGEPLNVN